jgi:hypothetical protein
MIYSCGGFGTFLQLLYLPIFLAIFLILVLRTHGPLAFGLSVSN